MRIAGHSSGFTVAAFICQQNLPQQVFKRIILFDNELKFQAWLRYRKLPDHIEKGNQAMTARWDESWHLLLNAVLQ
jgi:hypothetical protein